MHRNNEYIIASAYKLKEEYVSLPNIYKDRALKEQEPDYQAPTPDYDDIFKIEIGRTHADIIVKHHDRIQMNSSGFYTNRGRYVTREEAFQIAMRAGQIRTGLTHDSGSPTRMPSLYSEDIFWYDPRYNELNY